MANLTIQLKTGDTIGIKDLSSFNIILADGSANRHNLEDFSRISFSTSAVYTFIGAKTTISLKGTDVLYVELDTD